MQNRRSSPVRQLLRLSCCSSIIICVAMATVASSASTARVETPKEQRADDADSIDKTEAELENVAQSQQPNASPLEVSSGLAMLPKMKPAREISHEYGSVPEEDTGYYYYDEFSEPQVDHVDRELLERFMSLLAPNADTASEADPNAASLHDERDVSRKENVSDDGSTKEKPEMTSSVHDREKRSTAGHVTMTAEHMSPAGSPGGVERPLRLKRDLNEYLARHRWSEDESELSSDAEENAEENLPYGRYEDENDAESVSEDESEDYAESEDQLRNYLRELERAQYDDEVEYLPVVYRGVKGVFVPESSFARQRTYTPDELNTAADKWSVLVRDEVKKALDEYDLVYRLAEALKSRQQ